ncbi:MAG TPA: hypothetical protein P5571_14210 [Candidatus Krumholzibacteria bacterium]|nr:hypothetical protein [Candidatus Krumholzibacteria bacterium]
MRSRTRAILTCCTAVLLVGGLLRAVGPERTWGLWNIPPMSPCFADLRTITHGADAHALGLDPMLVNPTDPWGRRLDYPRLWQGLYRLGVGPDDTVLLGAFMILAFLAGICLILPDADPPLLAVMLAGLLSPSVLLGVERGNTDLLMVFLLAAAAAAVRRSAWGAGSLLAVGFLLKLFPLLGGAVLLRTGRRTFRRAALVLGAGAAVYLLITARDLRLMREASLQSVDMSYGLDVLWRKIAGLRPAWEGAASTLTYLALTVVGTSAAVTALRTDDASPRTETLQLDAFRAGAAVYVGSFVFDVNWDYRLMVLLLAVPQLLAWARERGPAAARPTLACVFLCLWSGVLTRAAGVSGPTALAWYLLEDAATWVVFGGLLHLLLWSAPAWLRADARGGRAASAS